MIGKGESESKRSEVGRTEKVGKSSLLRRTRTAAGGTISALELCERRRRDEDFAGTQKERERDARGNYIRERQDRHYIQAIKAVL